VGDDLVASLLDPNVATLIGAVRFRSSSSAFLSASANAASIRSRDLSRMRLYLASSSIDVSDRNRMPAFAGAGVIGISKRLDHSQES
jgi:hypothetical protein